MLSMESHQKLIGDQWTFSSYNPFSKKYVSANSCMPLISVDNLVETSLFKKLFVGGPNICMMLLIRSFPSRQIGRHTQGCRAFSPSILPSKNTWLCYFLREEKLFSLQFPLGPPFCCAEVGNSSLRILQRDWTKLFFRWPIINQSQFIKMVDLLMNDDRFAQLVKYA